MYKKAGIIVGILLIVVAIVIFLIANAVSNKSANSDTGSSNATTSASEQVNQPVSTAGTSATTPVVITETEPAKTTTPVVAPATSTTAATTTNTTPQETQAPVQSGSSLVEIEVTTLPEHTNETDVGTVVGRKVYALNGQIVYSLLINTTTHGQLEYFTNLTNYNIEDGTLLDLSLRVFHTSSVSYPSIISVSVKS